MEQKKKKQRCPGVPHLNDEAPKGAGEIQTITTNRFPISLAEEEMCACVKKSIREIVFDRGYDNISLAEEDEQFSAHLARFLVQDDYHTGFLIWGKFGCGKTTRLKAAELLLEFTKAFDPELELSVKFTSAYDMVFPYASMETFDMLCMADFLMLDDLGNERGIGENLQLAQSLIGELLIKRYDAKRPTIVASIFDIHNIGDIYGRKVADIIRESYYVTDLSTDFRRDIINTLSEL